MLFLYGFVTLWFQVVVCSVALIFLTLPAAFLLVVYEIMMCFCFFSLYFLKKVWACTWSFTERWESIANILNILGFLVDFYFIMRYFAGDALCYYTWSCRLTRQHLFLYVRSSVVWTHFRNDPETGHPGNRISCCASYGGQIFTVWEYLL